MPYAQSKMASFVCRFREGAVYWPTWANVQDSWDRVGKQSLTPTSMKFVPAASTANKAVAPNVNSPTHPPSLSNLAPNGFLASPRYVDMRGGGGVFDMSEQDYPRSVGARGTVALCLASKGWPQVKFRQP